MWFLFALLNAIGWATVIVFDRFIIKRVFSSPIQGMLITIPTSVLTLVGIFPLIQYTDYKLMALSALAGFFYQMSQIFYFYAINETNEIGNLSALESTFPIFVTIGSVFLGMHISMVQAVGILCVVFAVTFLQWTKTTKFKKKYAFLILCDITFLTTYGLITDNALKDVHFLSFVGPFSAAIVLTGIAPFILMPKERKILRESWPAIQPVLPKLALIELINVIAVFCGAYAIGIGHPGVVTAVISTTPAFVFIFGYAIYKMKRISEDVYPEVKNLKRKVGLVGILVIGLGLLV